MTVDEIKSFPRSRPSAFYLTRLTRAFALLFCRDSFIACGITSSVCETTRRERRGKERKARWRRPPILITAQRIGRQEDGRELLRGLSLFTAVRTVAHSRVYTLISICTFAANCRSYKVIEHNQGARDNRNGVFCGN